jgi:hypothetical protein
MSDELFNYFINIIAFTNEMTKKLSKEMPELNTPRLKSGSECDANNYNSRINSCAVKAIYTVYNALYSPSISYTTIDNWLCANDYYAYSSSCNCWGVKSGYIITVLSHFLEGNSVPVNVGNLTNTYSSQCILILKGSTQHAVIFTFYEGSASLIHFSDPSGTSSEDTCSINDIQYVFKATKNN